MMDMVFRNILEISLFSIAVIVPLGLCANLLGRRYGVKWRYLLWVVVAARLVLPMQFSLPEAMEGLRMNLPAPEISAAEHYEPVQSAPEIPIAEALGTYIPEAPEISASGDSFTAAPAAKVEKESFWDFMAGHLELLWIAGMLAFAARQGWKYAAFRRMLKRNSRKVRDAALLDSFYTLCREMGMKKRPALYFCGVLPSPLCMGLFQPEIYVNSEDREPEDMRLILKHELTHCKRRDLWFKALLLLARTMHFFNPFIHWMAKLAERDMEYSCDVSVMRDCTLEERQAYSMAILRTVREGRQNGAALTTAFSGGKKELKTRFENIFDMGAKKRGAALFAAAALAACGGTAFVGCRAEGLDTVYGNYTEETVAAMYQAKPVSWEDDAAIKNLLELMPTPNGAEYERKDSYAAMASPRNGEEAQDVLVFPVNWEETKETAYTLEGETYADNRWQLIHAMLFLALADDVDGVLFIRMAKDINAQTIIFDRDYMKRYFGETDLRQFAADEETFRAFVQAVNKYFYHGKDSAQEIQRLVELDDAAAQKRMTYYLNEAGAGIVYGSYTEAKVRELFNAKLDYVGNASGVGKIFGLFPLPKGVTYSEEGMELFTTEEPYGAKFYLKAEKDTEILTPIEDGIWIETRWLDIQAMIFLALVDNADYVEYSLDLWETDASIKKIYRFDREAAKLYFGERDLREFTTGGVQYFQRFVLALNRYFYDGIDTLEQFIALVELDEAESQKRMEQLLYFRYSEKGEEEREIKNRLSEITDENRAAMLSSNPLDYTDCLEYKELVWMGEPALKYCLSAFAAGEDLDTLKGHIMKFVCQDILGQERNAEQTPGEWYSLYTAVDSMYCAPFVYDEDVYTDELAQYTFHSPAAEQWGVLAAGKSERLRAVYNAVSARYNSNTGGAGHKTTIFAPVVYGWEEKGEGFSAYLILCHSDYLLIYSQEDGYGFYEGDGASLPVRMDFERRNGGYVLANWTEAANGREFEESVNDMCRNMPGMAEKLIERAYGNEDVVLEQNIVYYMKAHYGEMNIPVTPTDGWFETDVVAEALEQNLKVVPFPLM